MGPRGVNGIVAGPCKRWREPAGGPWTGGGGVLGLLRASHGPAATVGVVHLLLPVGSKAALAWLVDAIDARLKCMWQVEEGKLVHLSPKKELANWFDTALNQEPTKP